MKRKKGKQGMMAIKIDLKKAYDRIEWDLLEGVWHKVGFELHLMPLIMKYMYLSASLSVLWNGVQLQSFKPSRGI